jgi:hypothetical protein
MAGSAEDGRDQRQRQDVRRGRHGGALAQRVPRLQVQAPPVGDGLRHRRQPATAHRGERVAGSDDRRDQDERQQHRDRVGEEPGHGTAVGQRRVLVLDDRSARRQRRGIVLGGCGATALGDVGGLVGRRGHQVADEVEAVPVGQPRRREQPLDRGRDQRVRRGSSPLADLAPLSTGGPDLAGRGVEGDQRRQLVQRLADRADQQEADHPQQRAQAQPDQLEGQRARTRVHQQRVEGGAPLLVVRVPAGQGRASDAAVGGLGVEDHGLRDDQGPVSGRRRAPAEVDVVAEDRQLRVEPAQLLEHRSAHEHAGGVDREHRAHLVVLALVVLAAFQAGLAPAGAGDGHAELEEPLQGRPLAQLRPEHVGLGVVVCGAQQGGQRSGCGSRVVVEDPDPVVRRVGTELVEAELDGDRERGRGRGPDDLAERVLEQRGALVLAAGVDGDHASGSGRLGAEPLDHVREPARPVVADQQHGDGSGSRHDERHYPRTGEAPK